MTAMRRAANGYILREEFFDEWQWHLYLKRAMSRRRDYRSLAQVASETSPAAPPSSKEGPR